MKRIVLALLFIALLFSCAKQRSGRVIILHTNDMHCQYTPLPATWIEGEEKPLIGGMVALQYFMNRERVENQTLVLDAGDIMTGTPLSKITIKGARGGGFVKMMNLIGYDAMAIGNHEFDEGVANLINLLDSADFDVLSANTMYHDSLLAPKPYNIYEVSGLRIGVIGLLLPELDRLVLGKNMEGITVRDAVSTAQAAIDEIDSKTDLIVLLTHVGHEGDVELATGLHGVDIIIGGHSHTRVVDVKKHNGILVLQAGSKTTNLGKLEVMVNADSVSKYTYELIPTFVDSVNAADPEMQSLVKKYDKMVQDNYGAVIGRIHDKLIKSRHEESDLGNFLTDILRKQTEADFAVLNSGGIRKSLFTGPLTQLDINEVLPFTNHVVTFECSGQEILTMIRHNAKAMVSDAYGILQVSGLTFRYRTTENDSVQIISAKILDNPLDPNARYTGATVDFVMGHAENYFNFVPTTAQEIGYLISDLVIDYVSRNPNIYKPVGERMVQL
jgi:5'-nucleotidase / UDP-sugar diphosphatase